ncbi:ABC transporter ATP-binding protein [Micromonospora auratinigra]|uniref:ABC transporter ATP-binding protein n=1 Tax=Micromonospora auratinigra TaxID=261654 RepID=UPI001430FD1D|nr:ABC transporter ATP-binding protein [Micromonospora auratinigra]
MLRLTPGWAAGYLLGSTVAAAASVALPAVAARATDGITGDAPGTGYLALLVVLVARGAAELLAAVTREAVLAEATQLRRGQVLRHLFSLSWADLRRRPVGDLVGRLVDDVPQSVGAAIAAVDTAVAVATSCGGLALLFLLDPLLGAVFVVGVLPAWPALRVAVRRIGVAHGEYQRVLGAIAARLTDAVSGGRTIRAAGSAAREMARVLAPLPALDAVGQRIWHGQRVVSWQNELVLTAARVGVLAVAGFEISTGRLSGGDFLAASLYLSLALALPGTVDSLLALARMAASTRRLAEVTSQAPQPVGGPAAALPPGPGAVSFQRVTVRAAGRTVLDNLELTVPPGVALAVVGASGSGKSTLTALLGRLLDPDDGRVLIDGVPVDAVSTTVLRREVAYAFARPALIGDRLGEAIGWGRPSVTAADLTTALEVAGAQTFVRRLPEAADTRLAAVEFSGGELQRLSLARAVAHDARILVLDDATSSLDTVTEAQVTTALTQRLRGRTRLVVAHRAVTAARCDLVAWLDGGRIRALGPHAHLWATDPAYRAVFGRDLSAPAP